MNRHLSRMTIAGAAVATLGLAAPAIATAAAATGTALGATTAGFDGAAKTVCLQHVDKRIATLSSLKTRVDGATDLDAATRTTLDGQLTDATNGLTTLKGTIDAADSTDALRTACRSQFSDYRVYALVVPRTRLVLGTARIDHAAEQAAARTDKLDAVIDKAAERGVPADKIEAAKASAADIDTRLAAAQQDVAGLTDQLLALTPAQSVSGDAKPVLEHARDQVKAAVGELKAARQDVKDIRGDLHSGRVGGN